MINGEHLYIFKNEIIRHATPKEIEKFKLSININKYNL